VGCSGFRGLASSHSPHRNSHVVGVHAIDAKCIFLSSSFNFKISSKVLC
jgi:hypothetical protein